jgi:L-threonylcarbamoyladenylate synthase
MLSQVTTTQRLSRSDLGTAAAILRNGGTVAFATETVYGLGANAEDADAISRIFRAKGRPSDNPLIVHLASRALIAKYCREIPDLAYQLMDIFCPGPLTLVLPKTKITPSEVTAGMDSVAVRFPSHPTARALLEEVGIGIAAPSANLSGRPSATTWQAVIDDLDGRIDAVICDDPTTIGLESTVLDLTSSNPMVLRAGGISLEQLREVDSSIGMIMNQHQRMANSPGLRHRHYQPKAKVVVLADSGDEVERLDSRRYGYIGCQASSARQSKVPFHQDFIEVCRDPAEYARKLYDFFRRCDEAGIDEIWCQAVQEVGLGRAIMDRVRRAAE